MSFVNLTGWSTPVTKNDITNLTKMFNETHPDVKATLVNSNSDGVLRIYIDKETPYSSAVNKAEMKYSEFLHGEHPLLAIAFRMEEAYRELIADEEKEMTVAGFDLTAIASDFIKEHPGVCVRFHASYELDALKVRVETEDCKARVDRAIPRVELTSSTDPAWVIYTTLEEAYKELMKEKEDKDMPTKGNAMPVDNDYMLKMARCAVASWYNTHGGPGKIKPEDVYVVWFCKTLQNWKALCSTDIHDGMYYEVTYDGDKDAAYVDAYKKWDNQEFLGENLRRDIWKRGFTVGSIDGKE